MITTIKPKQAPGFSFHPGHQKERAIRYLVNNRRHPKAIPPPRTAKPFSIRLGDRRKLALTQLARNKGLDYEIVKGERVQRPESGWLALIHAALSQYLDREVPGWERIKPPRTGGSKRGWSAIVGTAIDEYLDVELPGW
jgi:hypothetical protein